MGERSEVLYDGGKCTSLLLADHLLFGDVVAKPLNDMADLRFLFSSGCQWCDLHMHSRGCGACTYLPAVTCHSRTLRSDGLRPVTRTIAFLCH